MARTSRLHALIDRLRDGQNHRACDLATEFDVTERTIYRDMARLQAEGVPVSGTPGQGYRKSADVTLPPLALSWAELEALHLGLAIVGEAGDPDLRDATASLSARIDAALPEDGSNAGAQWGFTATPTRMSAQNLMSLPTLRAALRGRQKLAIATATGRHVIRPLALDYWGRVWSCGAWCETCGGFHALRLDEITDLEVLTALFVDAPGRDLAAFRAQA